MAQMMEGDIRRRLIVALDVDSADRAMTLVEQTRDSVGCFKIGLQLFIQEGPAIVARVKEAGADVFLDLKLHDIPNTISAAARSVADLGAALFTVHCANGGRGLSACVRSLAEHCGERGIPVPRMLGVTILTSLSEADVHGLGFSRDVRGQVDLLAEGAYQAGLRGLVASPLEAFELKKKFPDVYLVTPGIRPAGADSGDQSRVTTPSDAIQAGADALVVGRPITGAAEPAQAAARILAEMVEAFGSMARTP